MHVFLLEGPHEFESIGFLEPTLVIHWQFLNEPNEGQLNFQAGTNSQQSGNEPDLADLSHHTVKDTELLGYTAN